MLRGILASLTSQRQQTSSSKLTEDQKKEYNKLFKEIENGSPESLEKFLNQFPYDLNLLFPLIEGDDKYKETALTFACKELNDFAVDLLVKKGADSTVSNGRGYRPIHQLLLTSKINFYNSGFTTEERNRAIHILQILCAKDDNKDARAENMTPLMSLSNDPILPELAQTLIECGADVKAETSDGKTTLMLFAKVKGYHWRHKEEEEERYQICKLILDSLKARENEESFLQYINKADVNGTTALMDAVSGNGLSIVKLLLNNGADITAKDNRGKTVFDYLIVQDYLTNPTDYPEYFQERDSLRAVLQSAVEKRGLAEIMAAPQIQIGPQLPGTIGKNIPLSQRFHNTFNVNRGITREISKFFTQKNKKPQNGGRRRTNRRRSGTKRRRRN